VKFERIGCDVQQNESFECCGITGKSLKVVG